MFRLESLNCYGDGNCGAVGLRGGQRGGGQPGLNGREGRRYRRGVLRVLRVEAERCREPDWVAGIEIPSSGLRSIGHRVLEFRYWRFKVGRIAALRVALTLAISRNLEPACSRQVLLSNF